MLPEGVDGIFPLTSVQRGMLAHALGAPESGTYIQQISTTLTGPLDVDSFKTAWSMLVERHAALRTVFLERGLEQPVQVVRSTADTPWQVEDWSGEPESSCQLLFEELLTRDRQTDFELQRGPLSRMHLIRRSGDTWIWLWTFHHLLCDGWSVSILWPELWSAYQSLVGDACFAAPEPTAFGPFVSQIVSSTPLDAAFWRDHLHGFRNRTSIPADSSDPDDLPHRQHEHECDPTTSSAISRFAGDNKTTVSAVLNAAWAIVLSRASRTDDVVFGTTVSGRTSHPNAESAVGMFINTLPMRVRTNGAMTVLELLQAIQGQLVDVAEREHSSLQQIQKSSEVSGPLFDSVLVFENHPTASTINGCDIEIQAVRHFGQSNFPLAIIVVPGNRIRFIIIRETTRYSALLVESLFRSLEFLLTQIVSDPANRLDQLALAPPTRRVHTIKSASLEPDPDFCSIVQKIDSFGDTRPDHIAVTCQDSGLSYRQLKQRTNSLADQLCNSRTGGLVAVACERSVDLIVGIVAILKSGSAYLPLDASQPTERLNRLLADAGVDFLVTNLTGASKLRDVDAQLIVIDQQELKSDFPCPSPSDLAYAIYTSGSTGSPKAVEITHNALLQSTRARFEYYDESPERFLMLSPVWFDSSVAGIFWTLCAGGTLVLPADETTSDIHQLASDISANAVTHTLCLPGVYQLLLQHSAESLSSFRSVIVAGEKCPRSLVEQHRTTLPNTRLFNEYGPTEASVWATVSRLDDQLPTTNVPIGHSAPGCTVELLDHHGHPVPPSIPGEIHLSGTRLAKGYRDAPELTRTRFLARSNRITYATGDLARQRPDGQFEFLERIDEQIKVNGQRVDPTEIECALLSQPRIREAAVGLSTPPLGDTVPELMEQLSNLPEGLVEDLLSEVEAAADAKCSDTSEDFFHSTSKCNVTVSLTDSGFIDAPRSRQRKWLIDRAIAEFVSNLEHLDQIAPDFVAGSNTPHIPRDLATEQLSADEIMETWQEPLMQAMAKFGCKAGQDVLEIGFGRGIAAGHIQDQNVASHTVIEMNPHCVNDHYVPWRKSLADRDIRLHHGRWQDVLDDLDLYDAVFFHAYPMNEAEFVEHIVKSVTYAEHFFPTAASLLRPGGTFTYMTTEIDSVSRRHQTSLLRHFEEVHLRVQPLSVPENTRDAWWANSMVVLKAIKSLSGPQE